MSRTNMIALLAGAAFGLSGAAALAQSTGLDESRAYQAEMLADAQGRTSLLQGGTSGYDGQFFMASADGNYRLNVGGQIQFQYVWNNRDDDGADDEENTIGFRNRRVRLNFGGNLFNPDFTYYIQGGFSDVGEEGSFALLDAFGKYEFENGWMLRFGQFKLPLMREELVSSKYQLTVDRSIFNSVFGQGRSQGLEIGTETDAFRFAASFSDGLGTANTDFTSGFEADYALTARAEWKFAGQWEQFDDFTSWTNSDYAGMIGGAIHWQDGGETAGTSETEVFQYTIDASVEGNGWNLFGAFAGRHADMDTAGGDDEADVFGFLVQGGIFVAPQTELFARYDIVIPDDDTDGDNFSTITAGVNYYFIERSHAAKFTADFSYFIDEQDNAFVAPNSAAGLLPSDDDGQWAIRLQMQVLF